MKKIAVVFLMVTLVGCASTPKTDSSEGIEEPGFFRKLLGVTSVLLQGAGTGIQEGSKRRREKIKLDCTSYVNGYWIQTNCSERNY